MRKFVYSPNYGGGFSSEQRTREQKEFCLFHQGLIDAIESGDENILAFAKERFLFEFKSRWPGSYVGFAYTEPLAVGECPDGEQFRIEEYDGYETYVLRNEAEGEWF